MPCVSSHYACSYIITYIILSVTQIPAGINTDINTKPEFKEGAPDGQDDAQTVVCMYNVREKISKGKDKYYVGEDSYCAGGEGKIRIIPQYLEVDF